MSQRRGKLSRAAVALYRQVTELRVPGDDNAQSEEYWDVVRRLVPLIERQPWQDSILEVMAEDGPPSWYRADQVRDWHEARAIGEALEKAAAK